MQVVPTYGRRLAGEGIKEQAFGHNSDTLPARNSRSERISSLTRQQETKRVGLRLYFTESECNRLLLIKTKTMAALIRTGKKRLELSGLRRGHTTEVISPPNKHNSNIRRTNGFLR